MKKIFSIIFFAVVTAAVIWGAKWYNDRSDVAARSAAEQAGIAAEETQSKIMEKLKITDVVWGTGAEARNGDRATVNYVGTLDDGTKFDSSYDRKKPFTFTLGAGEVIQGWDLGVLGMKVGGKRTLVIPPELGYGARAVAVIPANSTLHFTVELLSVQH